jgi:hypothetical protein
VTPRQHLAVAVLVAAAVGLVLAGAVAVVAVVAEVGDAVCPAGQAWAQPRHHGEGPGGRPCRTR